MSSDLINQDIDPNMIYFNIYSSTLSQPVITTTVPGGVIAPVTTINGNSGTAVTGPDIDIAGGSTGYSFVGAANTLTLTVANAATVRSSISAAKSGTNADITSFTGLNGNTGFNNWTGTPDQASHAVYSGTASVGYVQAELQGVMDSLAQATGLIRALLTALLTNGVIET